MGVTTLPPPSVAPPASDVLGLPSRPTTDSRSLVRMRMLVLLLGYLVVAAVAGDIFGRLDWTLLIAPLVPTAVAVALVGRGPALRAIGAIVGVGAAVVAIVVIEGGGFSDVVDAFTSGVQGLLSTDWPSPARPDLVGAVAAVLATATAISDELAGRRRFHLLPLLPLLCCYLGAIALSAPVGVTWSWLVLLAAVGGAFAMLRYDGTLHDRLVLIRGERRIVPLLLIAVIVVGLITIPVSLTTRADPRRNDPAEQTAPLLDPIEATLALRALDPPEVLHRVTPNGEQALPRRWRSAALENYDGRRWSPNLTLRPIGTTLGPVTGPVIDADISFLDDNVTLVPLPGAPVSVGADVETDAERTVVRLIETPTPGDEIGMISNIAPTTSDAIELGFTPRVIDESTSTFGELAEGLAGNGEPVDQLAQLSATMRDEFVLDSQVQGGGLQLALIDRFLRDTQRGTAEQFAAAFVLLARSLGIEARIATGFVASSSGDAPQTIRPGDVLELSSADAAVWPEVQLRDGRWLAYDPVPLEEATDSAPPPPEPQVQSPAAPQPPIAPPPDPDTDTTPPDDPATEQASSPLLTVITWAARGALVVGALLLPFAAAAAVIAGIKYRRRRRRMRAVSPRARIVGAWATATDVLVDAGLDIDASTTDGEIAERGESLVAEARRDLLHLSLLASAATYGTPEHPDLLAEDATRCLEVIDDTMASSRTRWQRTRWRLSLRSLRSSTRSPVTA